MKKPSEKAAVYILKLRARSGADGIRALRALLKVALRRFQLKCLEIREAPK